MRRWLSALPMLLVTLAVLPRAIGAQQALTVAVPTGTIIEFNDRASCPIGWSETTAARGRYLVGLVGGGTSGATVGTALTDLENRPTGQHTHAATLTMNAHAHAITDPGHAHDVFLDNTGGSASNIESPQASGSTFTSQSATTGITVNNTTATGSVSVSNFTSVSGTNAPYEEWLRCEKS